MPTLLFTEETLRDGQQSLWANRMSTESMLPIAPTMDVAGYSTIDIMSGSCFESCIKYLNEDPWERLRLLRRLIKKTNINTLIRGRSAFGWRRFSDDAIELLIKCLAKIGINSLSVFDGLNDMRNIEWHIRVARKLGLNISIGVVFSESPVHTDQYFVSKAKEVVKLGATAVGLGDASGLLTPERTHTLVPAVRQAIGNTVGLGFTSHCGTGLGLSNYVEAMKHGLTSITCVSSPLSHGNSIPSILELMHHAQQAGLEVQLNHRRVKEIDDYFYWVAYREKRAIGRAVNFNPLEYKKYAGHQIPGGMMSHLVSQLKDLGLEHRLPEVLEEAGRVRQELGYPVMVTPFSQLVGVQAVFNVIEGERYRTVPLDLRLYARGFYGEFAAPIDPNVLDRIVGDEQPIDSTEVFSESLVSKVRAEQGPFKSDEELLLALFYSKPALEKFYKEKKSVKFPPDMNQPLSALLRELANRRDIRVAKIAKGPLTVLIKAKDNRTGIMIGTPRAAQKRNSFSPQSSDATMAGIYKPRPMISTNSLEMRKAPTNFGSQTEYCSSYGIAVTSPLLGMFYRSSNTETPPFVDVGHVIKEGDQIGIVKILEKSTIVKAPHTGKVCEICVGNETLVEYGQVIMLLEPVEIWNGVKDGKGN